jgi:hypothetical protein
MTLPENPNRPTSTPTLWVIGAVGGIVVAIAALYTSADDPEATRRLAANLGAWAIRLLLLCVVLSGGWKALRRQKPLSSQPIEAATVTSLQLPAPGTHAWGSRKGFGFLMMCAGASVAAIVFAVLPRSESASNTPSPNDALYKRYLAESKAPTTATATGPTTPGPTITERFERSKCAGLANQILEANVIGVALTHSQKSHYEPTSNRCYVQLDVHMADPDKFADYNSRYLYDGQTKELLAWITNKNEKRTAWASEGDITDSYGSALAQMAKYMTDERER